MRNATKLSLVERAKKLAALHDRDAARFERVERLGDAAIASETADLLREMAECLIALEDAVIAKAEGGE